MKNYKIIKNGLDKYKIMYKEDFPFNLLGWKSLFITIRREDGMIVDRTETIYDSLEEAKQQLEDYLSSEKWEDVSQPKQ